MRTDVAVTGIGLVTPGGATEATTWAALCDGRSLARRDDDLAGLPVELSCRVAGFDAEAELGRRLSRRLDRFTGFVVAAARQAVADAALDPLGWPATRVGVILGVGGNSMDFYPREFAQLDRDPALVSALSMPRSVPNMAAAEVALDLGARGPNFTVASACASGGTALGVARDLLAAGACDIVLAGGSESGVGPMQVASFAQLRVMSRHADEPAAALRPFDVDRDGMVVAEGAAVLVLERHADARRRGARTRALLRGYATTSDAHHPVAPHPDGVGAEQALRAALANADIAPRDVHHVNAHGTSTVAGDDAEARALHRTFDGSPPPVTATKSVLGHSLGAAGAIEAAVTVLTLEHQLIPPTANTVRQDPDLALDVVTGHPRPTPMNVAVSSSFGFGGHNTVLVFATP